LKKIRFCPKCKSTDIEGDLSVQSFVEGYNRFKCNKCGYSGMFFPEVDEKEYKKISKVFK